MKKVFVSLLFGLSISVSLVAMDGEVQALPTSGGPMNADWFYHPNNPFKKANDLYQDRQWDQAAREYELVLSIKKVDKYSYHMARVNHASCLWAQRKATPDWKSFDALLNVDKAKRLSKINLTSGSASTELSGKIILVRSDNDGIGDVFHFAPVIPVLQRRFGCYVILSVRDFLKDALQGFATAHDFGLVGEKSFAGLMCDYETHIISLLGHLELLPEQIALERVALCAPERAMIAVAKQINSLLAQGKKLAMVYVGENRPATLVGGKQLPHDTTKHGRNMSQDVFKGLLRKNPDLVIIDCGDENKASNVIVDSDQQGQCIKIAPEEQAFDTPIALALLMNDNENIIGFGADTGVTNVFVRALTQAAQKRMALIIPNGSKEDGEYDMRMEGQGSVYKQMISQTLVYKCETPQDQATVIERAYKAMTNQDPVMHDWIQ